MMCRVSRFCVFAFSCLLLHAASAAAQTQSVTLQWDANTEPDLAGYIIKYGVQPGVYTNSIDVGNQTTWTVSGLQDHYRYYFAVQAYNSARLVSGLSNVVNTDGVFVQTGGTLSNPRPSLFWRNSSTGELLTWHLNGSTVVDTRELSIPLFADLTWKIVGAGDLNGDSYPDLVWRNDTNGKLAAWLLQNNQVLSTNYLSISQVADLNWRIRAVGDVNGDKRADLVWQHETQGTLAVWLMNGLTVASFHYLSTSTMPDLNWKITGAGDLNDDGKADIVWRNRSTGGLVAWLLDGPQVLGWGLLSTSAVADQNWKIRALRDINSDGQADLVWQNSSTGAIVVWYMNKFQMLRWGYLSVPTVGDTDWAIVGGR
jgi:hypothetical protein